MVLSDAINITNKDVTNDAETITYNDFTSRKIKESHEKKIVRNYGKSLTLKAI